MVAVQQRIALPKRLQILNQVLLLLLPPLIALLRLDCLARTTAGSGLGAASRAGIRTGGARAT